ncbi:hypothetical protein BDZ94DRAFT_1307085 [Collybia nuda]|uniref:F-box domain-containing protein n=1 Tax=Collybia nuda TaxID=64659 RepID=A0A9P6CKL6_9AGAR|nr:hypothetical protein BDZ94DRAFT_1307085 [Collybia nuda]
MIYHRRALADIFSYLFTGESKYRDRRQSQVAVQGAYPPPTAANFFWIPVELVELIIDHCDRSTLRSSSLVCKYWRASTVHRLYSTVGLSPATSPAFADFLQSYSGEPIRRFVQSLSFTAESGCSHKSSIRAVKRLSALLQPSSLRLTIFDKTEPERTSGFWSLPPSRKDLRVFQKSFKTVTNLELTLFSNTFIEAARIISSFPVLETLKVSGGAGTRQIEWEFPGDHTSLPRTVHTIQLPTGDNSSAFLHWLHSHKQPVVQTLSLGGISLFHLTNAYLRKLGGSLQCLTISGLVYHQHHDPLFTVDLSCNANLRILAVLNGRRSSADVFRVLSRVTSQFVEEVEFDVYNPADNPIGHTGRYWSRLDALLASPQFSKLRRVIVNVNLKKCYKIEVQLPLAKSRKILRFRNLRNRV